MPNFRVNVFDPENGQTSVLLYNSDQSTLKTLDREYVVQPVEQSKRKRIKTPQLTKLGERNNKSHHIKFLRIVLGTKCNYKCAYCSQSYNAPEEQATTINDVSVFMSRLDEWLSGEPKRIELWGGEPLVYWKFLKVLIPELRQKFPNAQITTITNGSLLTDEIVDFLVKYRVVFSISHDAYGQSIRGDNILDDPEKVRIINRARHLINELTYPKQSFTFNTTYNKKVLDPIKAKQYFSEFFGNDIVMSSDPVLAVGRAEIDKNTLPDNTELVEFANNVATASMLSAEYSSYSLFRYVKQFYSSLENGYKLNEVGQKCDVDRDSSLVVDILGNVYTCQNFVKKGCEKGSVYDFENINVNNVQHFSNRECCRTCPFVHMCMGGCPAIQGKCICLDMQN